MCVPVLPHGFRDWYAERGVTVAQGDAGHEFRDVAVEVTWILIRDAPVHVDDVKCRVDFFPVIYQRDRDSLSVRFEEDQFGWRRM